MGEEQKIEEQRPGEGMGGDGSSYFDMGRGEKG